MFTSAVKGKIYYRKGFVTRYFFVLNNSFIELVLSSFIFKVISG